MQPSTLAVHVPYEVVTADAARVSDALYVAAVDGSLGTAISISLAENGLRNITVERMIVTGMTMWPTLVMTFAFL